MDGASRMFAAPAEIKLGGRTFRARGRLARHYAEMEQHVLSLRPKPIAVVKESLALFDGDPDMQAELLRLAVQEACRAKAVTGIELRDWMNTVPGTAFVTWLAIREDAPEVTREQVQEWLLEDVDRVAQQLYEATAGLPPDEAIEAAQEQVLTPLHDQLDRASGEDPAGNLTGPP